MSNTRPGWFNNTLRPKLGMDVKEDYILRPLIDAVRSLPNYNRDSSIKLHFNSYYIKPIKIQSELLEKEIKDDPEKIEQVKNKINEIANNVDLLHFFSKNEFEYDGIRRNNRDGTLQERIKRKDPTKKWDLRTSHLYYYRDMNGNDVEIPSIYDKIMNIETNYNNSINKWRNNQENKTNELLTELNKYMRKDSRGNNLMKDRDLIDKILIMEEFINKQRHKEEALDEIIDYINTSDNDGLKSVAERIVKQICLNNGIDREGINKIRFSQQENFRRSTNTNANSNRNTNANFNRNTNANTNININRKTTIIDEVGTEGCPSAGKEPTPVINKKDYYNQAKIFAQDKNTGCKNQNEVIRKMQLLNADYERKFKTGGKRRKSKRRKTNKRRNTKRRYRN
jgi:5'-deoxynucleotidase YfbR-like HD superfamily hydrolase